MNVGASATIFSLAIFVIAGSAAAQRYDSNTVIVTYRDRPSMTALRARAQNHSVAMAERFSAIEDRLGRAVVVMNVRGRSVESVVAELRKDPQVEAAELNYYGEQITSRPNDTFFGEQWSLENTGQTVQAITGTSGADIRWLEGMRLAPPTGEVVVAVIDSGIDYTHPDLVSNLWINAAEIPANSIDDDTNGFVDDVIGYDFAGNTTNGPPDSDLLDEDLHGTEVSGVIAAGMNNRTGIAGVFPRARLMILKHQGGFFIPLNHTLSAYNYAILMKGRGVNIAVINASFRYTTNTLALQNAVIAAGQAGIITCAGAGNDASNNDVTPIYPANYTDSCVVAVAATDANDQLAGFSNYSSNLVDLAAPGVNILSTYPIYIPRPGVPLLSQLSTAYTNYAPLDLEFSGLTTGFTAGVIDCNFGTPTSFPVGVAGKIALMEDTTNSFFSVQVSNAMAAGASAAVIFNSETGNVLGTLGYITNWIPAVTLSREEGLDLRAHLPATATMRVVQDVAYAYGYFGGTSLATPFVSGAMALMAVAFPADSVTQRIAHVLSRVHPVAALVGKVRTGGRLDLAAMLDTDNDALGDWWELKYTNSLTNLTSAVDSDGDGVKNGNEFVAGTDPTSTSSFLRVNKIINVPASRVAIQWPSVAGKRYRINGAAMPATVWTNASDFLPATPPLNTYTGAPGQAKSTWRVEVE